MNLKLQLAFVVALILGGCSQRGFSNGDDVSKTLSPETLEAEFGEQIEYVKYYLESINLVDVANVKGNTRNERLKSQDFLYTSYAKDLTLNGIGKKKLLKIAGSEENARALLDRYFNGKLNFNDYLNLTEVAVIAKVGTALPNSPKTFAGPSFFELEISNNLLSTTDTKDIIVMNAFSSHMRTLEEGKECVFFLSPTKTKHIKSLGPIIPDYLLSNLPDNFLIDSFPTYCSSDSETFSSQTQTSGLDKIKKSQILSLKKVLPR